MDPQRDLPRNLRPPAHGDLLTLAWKAELGPDVSARELAAHLEDLSVVLALGEKWGIRIARTAAFHLVDSRTRREGPGALARAAERLGYEIPDPVELEEWEYRAWYRRRLPRPPYLPFGDPLTLLQAAADTEMGTLMGSTPRIRSARYENPLELVLAGSGLLLTGAVAALRLARDWRSKQRKG